MPEYGRYYVGGDMAKCRSHSIRKSAVKWGVR